MDKLYAMVEHTQMSICACLVMVHFQTYVYLKIEQVIFRKSLRQEQDIYFVFEFS